MTVGYFAPLPPARTGVAEYAAGLLAGLRRFGTVNVNDQHASVALYQIGNNHLHRDIYTQALERPGVVLLHDAVLQHFFLGQLTEEQYIAEFVYNYGEWTRDLAREMYRQRAHSGMDHRYFQYPLLRRLVERSRAVIVHNAGAAALVRAHAPGVPLIEIPHYFSAPEPPSIDSVQHLRAALLPPGGTLFGVFGHLRETKRLGAVLRAFRCAYTANPRLRLLIAGEPASRDLRKLLDASCGEPGLIRRDYLPERDFWTHAAAVDACINLRYPTAGETSGIGIRLMGIGKPVAFTDGPEIDAYPPDACLRIEAGEAEEEMLAAYLLWLAQYPADSAAMGRAAAAHIARHHRLETVSEQFWNALRRFAG